MFDRAYFQIPVPTVSLNKISSTKENLDRQKSLKNRA